MAVFSIIQKSQLEGGHRLDAEYYQPEYLKLDENIKRFKFFLFGQIVTKFSSGENLPQIKYDSAERPFVRTQNVRPIIIDKEELTNVNPLFKNPPLVEEGDLLFVRVGEGVGNSSIVTSDWANASYSDNVIRVKIKYLDSYFVIVFLNSQVGNKYLERVKKGSARSLISKENIDLIKIFEPTPILVDYCKNSVKEAQRLVISSEFLYSQAENLLLEELRLKDFKIEDDLSYSVNLSKVKNFQRLDAEYFQPKYKELISKIKAQNTKPLLSMIENVQAKFNPILQSERKFRYVELANINSSIGIIDGFSEVSGEEAPSRAKRILKDGDVIVSSVEGSLKKVALVHKEQDGYLASTGFFQFRSKEILPEVMLVLAKSLVLQMQLEKQTSGTILMAVPKEAIKNIVIPILPEPTQQKIASSVCQSHQARKRAKELLEEAKQKVEKMILGEVN